MAPVVIKTTPQNLELDVDIMNPINASFSMPMNPGSLDSSFTLMQGTNKIVGVFSYYDTTAFFIPSNPLLPGTLYSATVSTGAVNLDGIHMQNNYDWSFTTHIDAPPIIVETDPTDFSTTAPLNVKVGVLFNMPMDKLSFKNTSFFMKEGSNNIGGAISFDGDKAIFTPTNTLSPSTNYLFTVTSAVKNSFGVPMVKDSSWTFTTGILLAPTVISVDPINNATNIPLNKTISATFSSSMDPLTISASTFTLKQGSNSISGIVSLVGAVATFTPSLALKEGLMYTAIISSGAKDLIGTPLANSFNWKFTTLSIPQITLVDPLDLSTGVELNKIINATFNMPMNPSTFTNSTVILKQGTNVINCGIGYSGSALALAPTVNLSSSTIYTVTITTGVKNLAGISIASDYTWSFTTGSIQAPFVVNTVPSNNEIDVPLNQIIAATFNEPMTNSSIGITSFLLKLGTSNVSGTVYVSNNTAYFKPSVNLISGKTYIATITTDAKNVAGVKLSNNYVWTFNTLAPTGPASPNLAGVGRFGIISGTAVSNNAGFSKINNLDVGIYPGGRSSITGFPPAVIVNGAMYASDDVSPVGVAAMLLQAKTDLTAAYLYAEGASAPAPASVSGDQGGKTLAPGIYKSTSTLLVQTGDLTLDAKGDVNAVWIFQIASAFTTVGGAGGNIILSGGAQAKNIYWQVGSSATIGGYTAFKGNILALTSITMGGYAVANGRMLARNGAVTMTSTNIINKP